MTASSPEISPGIVLGSESGVRTITEFVGDLAHPPVASPGSMAKASIPVRDGKVAAGFGYDCSVPNGYYTYGGGIPALVHNQKYRNNWQRMPVEMQMRGCRDMSKFNEFISQVLSLRWKCYAGGFSVADEGRATRFLRPIVGDIMWEELVMDNCVLLFKRGEVQPAVTVLDSERVKFEVIGGRQRIKIQPGRTQCNVGLTNEERLDYISRLGQKMYESLFMGKELVLWDNDLDWRFLVHCFGKRTATFATPGLLPILDTVDYLSLMGVGDWNLAWYRKDVIRQIKKGYAVKQGAGAGLDSVDITEEEVQELGKGFAKVNGSTTIPTNHDVDMGYVTISPDAFDEKQVEGAVHRLLVWGGIEAVALFGNFSQQNGAAPSLMRNARVDAEYRRGEAEILIRKLLAFPEFSTLLEGDSDPEEVVLQWSNTGLYSVDELKTITTTLSPGIASPQTIRRMWGLSDKLESQRMKEAHADLDGYIPPFEARQALIQARFPEQFPGAKGAADPSASGPDAGNEEGGRPTGS